MKSAIANHHSRAVPAWLAVPLTVFIALSPVALAVALTRDRHWQDYLLPVALGVVLLLVIGYWLTYVRRVEGSLQEERTLLRVLIDNLPDRIYIKDIEGRKILANVADWHASGKTRMEDFIGRTDLEVYPPELAVKYWEDDQAVLQRGESILNREEPALNAQGESSVWTLATKVPLRDHDGKLIGLVGISRDITDFKQATEAGRAARERYRKIFEESIEGIYQSSAAGAILTANPALAHMYGYDSPEQFIAEMANPRHDLYVNPLRRAEFKQAIEASGRVAAFESEAYRRDGSTFWILENARAVRDECGAVLYYEGTMVDITQRKRAESAQRKAEQKYRSFFENSIAGIFQTSMDGSFLAANPALAHILGYESPEELIASVTDLGRQLYADSGARAEFGRRLVAEGRLSGFEAELFRKDGSTLWILTNAVLVRDGAGQPAYYEGSLMEISAQKEIECTQQETQRRQAVWINQLEQRSQEISLLNEMSALIQCCPTAEEAFTVIDQQAQWLFPHDSGALYIINSSRNLAEAKATWGERFEAPPTFEPSDCWAFRRGQLHTVESVWAADPNINEPLLHCSHVQPPLPEAYLCIPLIAQGETLGMLHIRHTRHTPDDLSVPHGVWYTEATRQLAHVVADSLALSISNLKLRETLRQQSIRDPLTGMFNRRYLEESLEREIARAARAERPLGIIMLDIDHFKRFNDSFGHAAGDAVLRELGGLLRSQVRQADIACRFGGEEFALIMPDASLEVARDRAERIRSEVEHLEVQQAGRLLGPVTVSLGVAEFPRHGLAGEDVLQMADSALYQAKQSGRNRAVVAVLPGDLRPPA